MDGAKNEESSNNFDDSDKAPLKSLWIVLKDRKTIITIVMALSLVSTILTVFQPKIMQEMIDGMATGNHSGALITMLVIISVGEAVLNGLQYYLLERTSQGIILGMRKSLVGKILRIPMKIADSQPKGDLISRVSADTTMLSAIISSGFLELVSALLLFILAVVFMVSIDLALFFITLAAVVTGSGIVASLGALVYRASKHAQQSISRLVTCLERALAALPVIRAYKNTAVQEKKINASAEQVYLAGLKMGFLRAISQPMMSVCIQAAFLIVLIVGGARVASDDISLGQLLAFIMYIFMLATPFAQGAQAYNAIQTGLAAFGRITAVTNYESEPTEGRPVPLKNLACTETATRSCSEERACADAVAGEGSRTVLLEFKNVSFSYDEAPVLNDVSFTVEEGSYTAIIGPTGSGKTTIFNLIERFYQPRSGIVTFRGIDIGTLHLEDYRQRLGYVGQNATALGGTIRENLQLACPDASDEQLLQALGKAQLGKVISRGRNGLDLEVGDGASLISGGERQRLAWARVLLNRYDLYLFDEPTSSVDSATEQALNESLDNLRNGMEFALATVLIIAHRLSTVINADKIIVVDQGRINAVGTHQELLETNSLYRDLAARQLLV